MPTDQTITLRDTTPSEVDAIQGMEKGDAHRFIIPDSPDEHRRAMARPDVLYKSVCRGEELAGFAVLVLDPDGRSVELRRVVVADPGRGIGTRVMEMVAELCRRDLGRARIWLDTFEDNARGCHVSTRSSVTAGSARASTTAG